MSRGRPFKMGDYRSFFSTALERPANSTYNFSVRRLNLNFVQNTDTRDPLKGKKTVKKHKRKLISKKSKKNTEVDITVKFFEYCKMKGISADDMKSNNSSSSNLSPLKENSPTIEEFLQKENELKSMGSDNKSDNSCGLNLEGSSYDSESDNSSRFF